MMKKFGILGVLIFIFALFLVSCDKPEDNENQNEHVHKYVNEYCECGELDPNHQHKFINGSCVCGQKPAKDLSSSFERVFNYVEGFISNLVTGDLNLPKKMGSSDAIITYRSNNPEYITDEGKRVDHEFDAEASITCIVERNGQIYTKDFHFTSLGISFNERVKRSEAYIK